MLGKITAGVQLQPDRVELAVGPVQAQGPFPGWPRLVQKIGDELEISPALPLCCR